ncbi:heavy-metal-associated domain-containing protein [Candidatus Peribacteria bacterium]|nr:MAG: heavy-metal-associated domain-containing protein [Candidatus Peribacteria bacterium]
MKTSVSIPGIHCEGCAMLIKDVSKDDASIQDVAVDLMTKTVVIDHDDEFDLDTWTKEIESLNPVYKVLPVA